MELFNAAARSFLLVTGIISCAILICADEPSSGIQNTLDGYNVKINYPQEFKFDQNEEVLTGYETNDDVICRNEESALFPDPENCTHFWQCANGIKYHMMCSSQLWFNSDEKVCDYIWNHPLKQPCADSRCSADSTDLLAVHGDCSKYIQCSEGYAYVMSCCNKVSLSNCSSCYFDPVNLQCVSDLQETSWLVPS